ncbi:uncharacterized protein LOC115224798 [Argonauta hians]
MATLPFRLYAVIFCVLISVVTIHTLMCYKCEGTVPGSKCENNMKEFAKKEKSKYSSNCSDFNFIKDPVCVIETREINDKLSSLQRECSDGIHFNVDLTKVPYKKMLANLPDNNTTRCASTGNNIVCLTLCKEDFCNGPITSSSSIPSQTPLLATVQMFAALYVVRKYFA